MMGAKRSVRARSEQTGVGLIEVLISMVVLSIGMLGMAGLQLWTLRNNQSSMERGMAVVQTHSIADTMRADRVTAINGGFDVALDPAARPTGTGFAANSVTAWRANLLTTLGNQATGSVDCDGAVCTIVVQWNDQRAAGSSTDQTQAPPQEITTVVRL